MAIGLNHNTETIRPNEDSFLEVGSIYGSARSNTPSGYLLCDGSAISRTVYSRLFDAIGTTYGVGDGSTTFNLPDSRGTFLRGAGTSSGYAQNITVALSGTKVNDSFQSHRHLPHPLTLNFGDLQSTRDGIGSGTAAGDYNSPSTGEPTTGVGGTVRTGNETNPKYISINYFIKF